MNIKVFDDKIVEYGLSTYVEESITCVKKQDGNYVLEIRTLGLDLTTHVLGEDPIWGYFAEYMRYICYQNYLKENLSYNKSKRMWEVTHD